MSVQVSVFRGKNKSHAKAQRREEKKAMSNEQ